VTSHKLQDAYAYPPRAMKAERAAAYLDMSRSKFLELVEADRLPKPKIIDLGRLASLIFFAREDSRRLHPSIACQWTDADLSEFYANSLPVLQI
jgi:hypothetical protein